MVDLSNKRKFKIDGEYFLLSGCVSDSATDTQCEDWQEGQLLSILYGTSSSVTDYIHIAYTMPLSHSFILQSITLFRTLPREGQTPSSRKVHSPHGCHQS